MNTPYYNAEAEMSVLGAALLDEGCVKLVTDTPADTFHDPRHRIIRDAICTLAAAKEKVDLITVNDQLVKAGKEGESGGAAYLIQLMQYVPTTANAKSYLKILEECRMRRTLYLIGKELMERSGAMESPDETREWAARTVREVRLGDSVRLISMMDACMDAYGALERNQNREGQPQRRILSGIATLDNKLGGLRDGEYVAIGARPSVGKSILALTWCVNAAKQGKRVLFISLEMSGTQITERILASESGVPMSTITSGNMEAEHWQSIAGVVGPVSGLPLWYCLEATTVEKVRRAAYQLYENGGLDMIAVDYLQLMEATYARKQNRQEQISEISRGLRILEQEMQIPILVLTQLNRASVKERIDGKTVRREPTMSEARESGAIEQDANVFILLHNPEKDEMRSDAEREAWESLDSQGMTMMRLIIDKNRQGKKGRLTVAFDGDHMRFLPIVRNNKSDTPY